jgi:hypothetical protein
MLLFKNQQLHMIILFTDEAVFNMDRITNTRNSHIWSLDNPNASVETNFQSSFSVNIWCGIIANQLIRLSVLEKSLTFKHYLHFLEDLLSVLLDDIPLHIRRELWLQHDGTSPNFGRQVTAFLNQHFLNRWIGGRGQ